jgi:hypothetical protein
MLKNSLIQKQNRGDTAWDYDTNMHGARPEFPSRTTNTNAHTSVHAEAAQPAPALALPPPTAKKDATRGGAAAKLAGQAAAWPKLRQSVIVAAHHEREAWVGGWVEGRAGHSKARHPRCKHAGAGAAQRLLPLPPLAPALPKGPLETALLSLRPAKRNARKRKRTARGWQSGTVCSKVYPATAMGGSGQQPACKPTHLSCEVGRHMRELSLKQRAPQLILRGQVAQLGAGAAQDSQILGLQGAETRGGQVRSDQGAGGARGETRSAGAGLHTG